MTQIDIEDSAARTEVYENDYVDTVTGKQLESLKIDGHEATGILDFDPTNIELLLGGTNEDVTAVFLTDKKYWPAGNFPKPLNSWAEGIANGKAFILQVRQLNGDKDNRPPLAIGLSAKHNRGK